MTVSLSPYLNFRGQAREAMELYRSLLGGELTISTFAEYQVSQDPAEADYVMHSQLTTPSGLILMGADVPSFMQLPEGTRCSVSLFGGPDDEAVLRAVWDGLLEGADVQMPLDTAPWGDIFGGLTDRFGTNWMVNIGGQG